MTLVLQRSWVLAVDRSAEARHLAAQAGSILDPLTAQVLLNRGVETVESVRRFLAPRTELWHPPFDMLNMELAATMLAEAVRRSDRICVHGDYDCDGVSATALLVSFLRDQGLEPLWYIPHRIDEGYGISAEGVRWAASYDARLLITVDCGTSSPAEVALARELGLAVIVTDHHRVPPVLPEAHALVNPQQPDCSYPFKKLSGVGVALKLVQAAAALLGLPPDTWREYLDLATLGTVGDVVSLTSENRLLVVEGLERIDRRPRPGLKALVEATGAAWPLGARDVAFKVIPPINASGRLDHATTACELLLESDADQARVLAAELVALNVRRRVIEQEVTSAARERLLADDRWRRDGLILEAAEGWHRGVVGIVASRLLEEFHVPTLVVSLEDGLAKGSARSPRGVDLFECLSASRQWLTHFGGHPRAGGFSLRAEHLESFRASMVAAVVGREGTIGTPVDAAVQLADLSMEVVRELEQLAPFGEGNPEPRFALSNVRLEAVEMLKGLHARMTLSQAGIRLRALKFGRAPAPAEVPPCGAVEGVVSAEREVWRGTERMSLRVHELYPGEEVTAVQGGLGKSVPEEPSANARRLIDSRHVGDPRLYLHQLAQGGAAVVGLVRSAPQARSRFRYALFNRLEEGLQMLSVASPRIVLLPYGALREGADVGSYDVVWLAAPPALSYLTHPLLQRARRVHLLFTPAELEEERRFYQAATINQPKMEVLYQGLRRQLGDGPSVVSTADLIGQSSALSFNRVAVEAGLKAFEELGLVTRDASGAMALVRGVKTELSASPTFRQYSSLSERFDEVYKLLTGPVERLMETMWRKT